MIFLPSAHKIVSRATKIKVGLLKTCNNYLQVLKIVIMERCFQPEEVPTNPYG